VATAIAPTNANQAGRSSGECWIAASARILTHNGMPVGQPFLIRYPAQSAIVGRAWRHTRAVVTDFESTNGTEETPPSAMTELAELAELAPLTPAPHSWIVFGDRAGSSGRAERRLSQPRAGGDRLRPGRRLRRRQ
jgi:hypothetical protein